MTVTNYQISDYVKSVFQWYHLPTMEIGDIVLLGTKNEKFSWTSSKNIQRFQNILGSSSHNTEYSHVALCIDHGLFIEAKGPEKVIYSTYIDLYNTKSGERYAKHFRNKYLREHGKSLITERGLYYAGTPYSEIFKQLSDYIFSILPFRSHKQYRAHSVEDEYGAFCSALIVDILKPIKDKNLKPILSIETNAKYVLPSHIEQLMEKDDSWQCVDDNYKYLKWNNIRAAAYRTLGEVHKKYYNAKTEALKVTQSFFTVKDYYQRVPLWFRMHIYHLLKKGMEEGEVKEYLALKSLTELLEKENEPKNF